MNLSTLVKNGCGVLKTTTLSSVICNGSYKCINLQATSFSSSSSSLVIIGQKPSEILLPLVAAAMNCWLVHTTTAVQVLCTYCTTKCSTCIMCTNNSHNKPEPIQISQGSWIRVIRTSEGPLYNKDRFEECAVWLSACTCMWSMLGSGTQTHCKTAPYPLPPTYFLSAIKVWESSRQFSAASSRRRLSSCMNLPHTCKKGRKQKVSSNETPTKSLRT